MVKACGVLYSSLQPNHSYYLNYFKLNKIEILVP